MANDITSATTNTWTFCIRITVTTATNVVVWIWKQVQELTDYFRPSRMELERTARQVRDWGAMRIAAEREVRLRPMRINYRAPEPRSRVRTCGPSSSYAAQAWPA